MTGALFSKIKLYVSAYATIFGLAAFCLLCFHERHADNPNLNDNSWKEGLHTNRTLMRDSDPLSLTYAGLRWTSNVFNCSVVSEIENLKLVGAGWTKAVYKGQWKDRTVAIKTVNLHGHDVIECSRKGFPITSCYEKAAAKILREIALLTELQHKNIIKVLGTCVPGWDGALAEGVSVVTEFGEPLDTVRLLQMSFEERLRLALDVAEILHHLAHSPLGSLALVDFRKQQFVLVGRTLKLSDVDDISVQNCDYVLGGKAEDADNAAVGKFVDPRLSGPQTPVFKAEDLIAQSKLDHEGNCWTTQGRQNERRNVLKAGKIFIDNILIHGCPRHIASEIRELVSAYTVSGKFWNTSKLLQFTKNLYQIYMTAESIK